MKLRIKGNSLRFRVTPSEVKQLLRGGAIREHVQLTADPGDRLTYGPTKEVGRGRRCWVYTDTPLGDDRVLSVAIEKDFACLDLSGAENEDTFPNPNFSATC